MEESEVFCKEMVTQLNDLFKLIYLFKIRRDMKSEVWG